MRTNYYVSCFVVRRTIDGDEFLQLRRAHNKYMGGTWQLVTGGLNENETAWQAALRELLEETSLRPAEFFQVDFVNTFYLAANDTINHSPMFCALVDLSALVVLDAENIDFRWLKRAEFAAALMWPGERAAFAEVCREILEDGPAKPHLRIRMQP